MPTAARRSAIASTSASSSGISTDPSTRTLSRTSIKLERGVGGDRGAVDHALEPLGRKAQPIDPGENAVRLVLRRRRRFQNLQLARRQIEQDEVGERPADVDTEPEHAL